VTQLEEALVENLNTFVAFARARVGDPELAADIVQDCLVKALKAQGKPRGREGAATWFYRILRHAIIDAHRRRGVRERALERLQAEMPELPDAEAAGVVCKCVQRLLELLPAQYRDALQRVDLDGAAPGVVARSLQLTPNVFNVRLHRARRRLRGMLEESCRVCGTHGCLDCGCEEPQPAPGPVG